MALATRTPTAQESRAAILVIDDSAVARAVLTRIIQQSDEFELAQAVVSIPAALAFLADHRVDVILLDLTMPGIDGLAGLPDLLAAAPGARIIVVSTQAGPGTAATLQALALGAADTMLKPEPGASTSAFREGLLDKLRRVTRTDAPTDLPSVSLATSAATPPPVRVGLARSYDIVAIGASTGGIHALSGVLRAIPAQCDVPIVITQHLPPLFMPYFATQLAVLSGRPCDVATDRMPIRPGRVVVAPGDSHVRCHRGADDQVVIRLTAEPVQSGCLPSVDPMFTSIAAAYGTRVLAVVLSGMGRDGAQGAVAVAEAGGSVVIQSAETSVVWGMPGAVSATGAASATLAPDAIGELIASGRRPA